MTNAFSLFRALIIYGICLPLAIFLGYLLATPDYFTNEAIIAAVIFTLTIPLFLRWYHPLLVLSWNMVAVMFFLPGHPLLFLPVCAMSFMVAILQYTLNRELKFINVPPITKALLAMVVVAVITARFTGGMGLRFTGSASFGGKRYIALFSAIAGYFALTSKRVPLESAALYVKLYFLATLTSLIASLSGLLGPGLYYIFLLFPGDPLGFESASTSVMGNMGGVTRAAWTSQVGPPIILCLLALYGIRGLFDLRSPWRFALLLLCLFGGMLGGFRGTLISIVLTFAVQFYFEGLLHSRMLPTFLLASVLGAAVLLPFTDRLPLSVQRTLSFLPLNLDPVAVSDAQGSTEWRLQMWKRAAQDIPDYLLLGKGYSMNAADAAVIYSPNMQAGHDAFEGSMYAGDYHSGPLSVILTFGLWGVFAFLWFLYVAIKTLYQNYAHGDPRLKNVNTLLLAAFISKTISFFVIFGSLYSDMAGFTGLLGLSVCLNGGVRVPAPAPVVRQVFNRFKLVSAPRPS